MIQEKNVCVGNYLQNKDGKIIQVDSVSESGINLSTVYDSVSCDYRFEEGKSNTIYPIPLTEEWLLRFGFINGISYYLDIKEEEGISINPKEGTFEIYGSDSVTNGHVYHGVIQYVHQLQNLYFALAGKELEIQ